MDRDAMAWDTAARSRERLADVRLWRVLQRELSLSDRQLDVAILLVLGLTLREVSLRLHISKHTVATHYERLKIRVGERDRTKVILGLLHKSGLLLDGK